MLRRLGWGPLHHRQKRQRNCALCDRIAHQPGACPYRRIRHHSRFQRKCHLPQALGSHALPPGRTAVTSGGSSDSRTVQIPPACRRILPCGNPMSKGFYPAAFPLPEAAFSCCSQTNRHCQVSTEPDQATAAPGQVMAAFNQVMAALSQSRIHVCLMIIDRLIYPYCFMHK